MAIKTLKISDETWAKYELMDPKNPLKAAADQLDRFGDFNTNNRVTILRDDIRVALERLFEASLDDQDRFLQWVKDLKECELDGVRITLNEGQRKRVQAEAMHRHRTFKQQVEEKLKWAISHAFGY